MALQPRRRMLFEAALDHHLVSTEPAPAYMGELPDDYGDVPAPIVINLCGVFPRAAPQGTVVFSLPMHDALDPSLAPTRGEVEKFLSTVHHYTVAEPSYWHCHAGLNRSGFVLAAYLHLYRGLTISQSIANLRRRRSEMVLCNHLFEGMLREWYGAPEERAFEPVSIETYLQERRGARR